LFTPRSSALLYAVTRYWDADDELGFRWDDPELDLPWPTATLDAVVSDRDQAMPLLADVARLPSWSGAHVVG
jgi:dTDP-4-dehydrorhamnose 3,5-epimerase